MELVEKDQVIYRVTAEKKLLPVIELQLLKKFIQDHQLWYATQEKTPTESGDYLGYFVDYYNDCGPGYYMCRADGHGRIWLRDKPYIKYSNVPDFWTYLPPLTMKSPENF